MKKLFSAFLFLFAVCLSAPAQSSFPVRFAQGTEFFPENFALIRQLPNIGAEEIKNGVYPRYIQLEKIMNARERAAFEATGARVIGYVQFGAYLVLLPQNFDFQKIERFSPRSIVPVKPEWKMAISLREPPYGAWAQHGNLIDVNIQVYPSLNIVEGAALCRKYGLEVLKEGNQNGFVQLRIHKDHVYEVAALPFVQYLELVPPPAQKEDTRGRSLHRSNLVASDAPAGKKYDGTGVGVLIRDDGQFGPHIDLQGRLHNFSLVSPESGTHGDAVVGIAGGAGNLDPTKKGMATGSELYSVDYVNDFQDLTLPLHLSEGITITNSSYGDGCNSGYTLAAQTVDQQIFEHPTLMHVFSGGNTSGTDCGYGAGIQWGNITGGNKMAKNCLAVANVFSEGTLESTSSRGPAYDGRLKPDIAANGQGQESLDFNNDYQVFGGTSGAAPGITGCLAQLTQAYRTIYGVQEVPSALLKATILNTANDLGNVGPDFKFGWGLVNTWRSLLLLEQNHWLEGDADQNDDLTPTIQIPPGVKEARIMLYWAEPPAGESNAKALINDLDLTVNDPNGMVNMPWKLNPAPVPAILNAPAGKGRDSLNNVEQVVIVNPDAGTYTVHIKGAEVPMGPQHYYIVWEFIRDEIKVCYPAGGEGFVPDEVERIHWDAYGNMGTFNLSYSTDGGNSFLPIASVAGDRRTYDWAVPNTISGKVYMMVMRGSISDTTDFPFSIVPVPQGLEVVKVCPDTISLQWTPVNDTLTYDSYLLGSKYMELKGTSTTNFATIPIQNAGIEQWLSVRTSYPDGTAGRRALAIKWPGGLLNCPQAYDLAVTKIISPAGDTIVSCGTTDLPVKIRVQNNGGTASSGVMVFYQLNNDPPVQEALPDIPAAGSLDFSFQASLHLDVNENVRLRSWVVFSNDHAHFNDTASLYIPVFAKAADQFFIENFESQPGFPAGWASVNPDTRYGWVTTDALSTPIIGPDGLEGRSAHMNFFFYAYPGEEDYLYMIPIDLANLNNPDLTFEVAHARYDDTYSDGLRVEVFTNCDLGGTPLTLWAKNDPELATVADHSEFYHASSADDWRKETVDLSPFAGQKIVIRFVAINGYGNSLYLDNIGIEGFDTPNASFIAPDSTCRLDTVIYQATQPIANATYFWSFGSAAIPSTATGIGPHQVVYNTVGDKTVRLIVTTSINADTMTHVVAVRPVATANFIAVQNGLTVTFSNASTNAISYLWDFGDGMTSTDMNPIHTYATPGTFVVTLSATNPCRTHVKTATVGVTSLQELTDHVSIRILPNPTMGDFYAELDSHIASEVQLTLYDAAGRKIIAKESALKQGITRIAFENLNLPKGLYQLTIQVEGKLATFKVAVQ